MFDNLVVSVIIPVYNVELYLDQCIDSVVNQTYSNLEIILVNDGSTDNSTRLCDLWKNRDKRIIVINQKNKGLSGARNEGIKVSSGKYITFLDSDDWLNLATLDKSVKLAEQFNYDLVFWQMIKEYEDKSLYVKGPFVSNFEFNGDHVKKLHRRITGPIGNELKIPQHIDSFSSAWGKLYKKSIIFENKIEFVDTKIIGSEDILFNFYYFNYCKSALYLHEHLIHYRKDNPTSLTKTHGSTLFPRFINLFHHIQEGIIKLDLGRDFEISLQNRIAISIMNIGLSETSPRNSKSNKEILKSLTVYLNHPLYRKAFERFSFPLKPFHWWIFFYCCKNRWSYLVFVLLKAMRIFIK